MMAAGKAGVLQVVAGVLCRDDGKVLLAQRPAGRHMAGMWEFPGGKCEQDESPEAALARELQEELGIQVVTCAALITVPWDYPERSISLMAFKVHRWDDTPRSCEGQLLRWQHPDAIDADELAPADRPVLAILRGTPCRT